MQAMMVSGEFMMEMLNEEYMRGARDAIARADDICYPTTDNGRPNKRARRDVDPELILIQMRCASDRVYHNGVSDVDHISIDEVLGIKE